jgi:flagellar hook-basal body complex protein FliE
MMNVTGVTGAEPSRPTALNTASTPAGDESFQTMFARVAAAARDTMRAGEAASIAGINGDASVQEVVEAVMSAEQQLRAAIAVRDRVVAAYQEISRMQI